MPAYISSRPANSLLDQLHYTRVHGGVSDLAGNPDSPKDCKSPFKREELLKVQDSRMLSFGQEPRLAVGLFTKILQLGQACNFDVCGNMGGKYLIGRGWLFANIIKLILTLLCNFGRLFRYTPVTLLNIPDITKTLKLRKMSQI